MARSGKPDVRVLYLAVLVVVTIAVEAAVGFAGAVEQAKSAYSKLTPEFIEDATKNLEKIKKGLGVVNKVLGIVVKKKKEDDKEQERSAAAGSSTPVVPNDDFPRLPYVGVTGMKVGGAKLIDMEAALGVDASSGNGGVLVSSRFPLTFLNAEAYKLLEEEVSKGGRVEAASELGAKVEQPCYVADGTEQAITLVFAGGAEMKVEADTCWYEQSDGTVCLAVLPAPWTSGETIIGTMLQQSKMVLVGDNWTF